MNNLACYRYQGRGEKKTQQASENETRVARVQRVVVLTVSWQIAPDT